jgi:hypothetical protein
MLPDRPVGTDGETSTFGEARTRPSAVAGAGLVLTLLAMGERVAANRDGLPEATRVRRWRRSQFIALGFTPTEALLLTKAPVDLGEMRRLIASGCPLEVARRIVL